MKLFEHEIEKFDSRTPNLKSVSELLGSKGYLVWNKIVGHNKVQTYFPPKKCGNQAEDISLLWTMKPDEINIAVEGIENPYKIESGSFSHRVIFFSKVLGLAKDRGYDRWMIQFYDNSGEPLDEETFYDKMCSPLSKADKLLDEKLRQIFSYALMNNFAVDLRAMAAEEGFIEEFSIAQQLYLGGTNDDA